MLHHHIAHVLGFGDQWWYVITHWRGSFIPWTPPR